MLGDLGWPLSEAEIVERFVGRPEENFVREIEAHLGHPLPRRWEDAYQHLYTAAFEKELQAVDGVVDALDQITTATCVASSGGHGKIRRSLRLTNLYERFERRIFSASEVAKGKPARDLFLHAAARLGVPPARCAVVEDSRYGVEATGGRHGGLRLRRRCDATALARRTRDGGLLRHARVSGTSLSPTRRRSW